MTPTDRREALGRVLSTLEGVSCRSVPDDYGDEDNECAGCGDHGDTRRDHAADCPIMAARADVEALLAAAERGEPWP